MPHFSEKALVRLAGLALAAGVVILLLLWRPWTSNGVPAGFKAADEEMRKLLQEQNEARQASALPDDAKSQKGEKTATAEPKGSPVAEKAAAESSAKPPAADVPQQEASAAGTASEPAKAAAGKPAESATGKINLNTATAEQFDELPGIGPSRAQAIVALRKKLGGSFKSVDQLLEVKGIGKKTLQKIRPLVTLEP
ncbi:helix-hairpin-helix domain-containing protein [Paenibacillus sp. MZ04-78.2]|uniref:ComEA family DNA-binding protein n=1 Tax=Paenibacillus sp. MZ04-78.2 TaxID=2962034 RepID=UPI0020B7C560|nr:helix-hairpin-helix domain-containing protein [Paenibacillus sp. MZ04-78.2]MCP3772614.1 helix-hairpin-helix domain-containing protein [Paenibacillus sp. MZ04-78.2]